MSARTWRAAASAVVVVVIVAVALLGRGDGGSDDGGAATGTPSSVTSGVGSNAGSSVTSRTGSSPSTLLDTTATDRDATDGRVSAATVPGGMALVALSSLPPEATDTWELIEAGGPFPFDRDGVVFQNREALLPAEPRGHYREYTVVTPGEDDRGARRMVVGGEQESVFYTGDHYASFVAVDVQR